MKKILTFLSIPLFVLSTINAGIADSLNNGLSYITTHAQHASQATASLWNSAYVNAVSAASVGVDYATTVRDMISSGGQVVWDGASAVAQSTSNALNTAGECAVAVAVKTKDVAVETGSCATDVVNLTGTMANKTAEFFVKHPQAGTILLVGGVSHMIYSKFILKSLVKGLVKELDEYIANPTKDLDCVNRRDRQEAQRYYNKMNSKSLYARYVYGVFLRSYIPVVSYWYSKEIRTIDAFYTLLSDSMRSRIENSNYRPNTDAGAIRIAAKELKKLLMERYPKQELISFLVDAE